MKKREHRLFIRVTDAERNRILDKMYGMGIHSLSAYMSTKDTLAALSEGSVPAPWNRSSALPKNYIPAQTTF